MKTIKDECVGCPPEIGCLGSSCPYKDVVHYYCDNCGEETQLYYYDDKELCIDCIEKTLEKVEE